MVDGHHCKREITMHERVFGILEPQMLFFAALENIMGATKP
jgi:hypothetical protein